MPGEELNFNDREVVLRADLTRLDDRDCTWTPTRFLLNGPRAPQPGERVLLVDTGGMGACLGRVVSVAGWEACVRPDWETWSGPTAAVWSLTLARTAAVGPGLSHGPRGGDQVCLRSGSNS